MMMVQYLTFTNHALWEVIVNGDSVSPIASASAGAEGLIPPKTDEQKLARNNELKAKSTLMLSIPDENLLKFHACKDTKSLWEAIKNMFEATRNQRRCSRPLSSRITKTLLHQVKKDWIKPMIAWNNIALIMRNKSDLDTLSMDALYNNLKVYESEIKIQSSSSLNSQNVAFVSLDNTSSTNELVNIAHSIAAASSKDQASTSSYADDGMFSFFSNQSDASQLDNEDLEQSFQAEEELTNFTLMAYTSQGYQMGLESLEVRIIVHEKNNVVYEEDIAFLKYDVQVKDISIKELKNQLENALKEKDELKLKLENFQTSFKNITKQINSQICAIDKTGLGYDGQMNESDLNDIHVDESEVLNNMVDSHKSDRDDNQVNDRFKKVKGYHAVSPPYTEIYMPPRADLSFAGLDNYVFKSKVSETITSVPKIETNASKTSKDSLEKYKTVRSSAPLTEE
nr:ribonuclease H-like domain-containing protein [Tanacetum cinerariifolium]